MRPRRCRKRLFSSVSAPEDLSSKKIKILIEDMVREGEIDIGENVVEKIIVKRIDKSTGSCVTDTFSVHARKHPLSKLRVKLFDMHKQYMRLNSDSYFENLSLEELTQRFQFIDEYFDSSENLTNLRNQLKCFERTRNFQIWHDASSILNHSHILFCVNVIYDPAVFFTSSEYEQKNNIKVDIQKIIEAPELYIIGRCANNDEQLGYIGTRVSCLENLKDGLQLDEAHHNIVLNDKMRFFHGDGPATAFEAGNQKGGHYFCPTCDVHICLTDDIAHSYQQNLISLEEKQKKVL